MFLYIFMKFLIFHVAGTFYHEDQTVNIFLVLVFNWNCKNIHVPFLYNIGYIWESYIPVGLEKIS